MGQNILFEEKKITSKFDVGVKLVLEMIKRLKRGLIHNWLERHALGEDPS